MLERKKNGQVRKNVENVLYFDILYCFFLEKNVKMLKRKNTCNKGQFGNSVFLFK